MDASGKVKQEQHIGGKGNDQIHRMTSDMGKWAAVGQTNAPGTSQQVGWVLAGSGLQKQVDLGIAPFGGMDGTLYGVALRPNGAVMATGTAKDNKSKDVQVWFLRVDPNGSINGDVLFGPPGEDEGFGVAEGPQPSGFAIVGRRKQAGKGWQGMLATLDSGGKYQGSQDWGGVGDDELRAVMSTPEGWIAAGSRDEGAPHGVQGWMIGTDKTGKKLWDRSYGGKSNDKFRDMRMIGFSGFALVGKSGDHPWVVRIEGSGQELWQRTIAGAGNGVANSVLGLANDDILLIGSGVPAGMSVSNGFIRRLDRWGFPDCKAAGPCAKKKIQDCKDTNLCTIDTCEAGGCSTGKQAPENSPCGPGQVCKSGQCKQ